MSSQLQAVAERAGPSRHLGALGLPRAGRAAPSSSAAARRSPPSSRPAAGAARTDGGPATPPRAPSRTAPTAARPASGQPPRSGRAGRPARAAGDRHRRRAAPGWDRGPWRPRGGPSWRCGKRTSIFAQVAQPRPCALQGQGTGITRRAYQATDREMSRVVFFGWRDQACQGTELAGLTLLCAPSRLVRQDTRYRVGRAAYSVEVPSYFPDGSIPVT